MSHFAFSDILFKDYFWLLCCIIRSVVYVGLDWYNMGLEKKTEQKIEMDDGAYHFPLFILVAAWYMFQVWI